MFFFTFPYYSFHHSNTVTLFPFLYLKYQFYTFYSVQYIHLLPLYHSVFFEKGNFFQKFPFWLEFLCFPWLPVFQLAIQWSYVWYCVGVCHSLLLHLCVIHVIFSLGKDFSLSRMSCNFHYCCCFFLQDFCTRANP